MTKVAIIEDNDTMRKMLVELINSEPEYRCVCACSSSSEALVEVPKHQPDVALMDIHLPDESGIACTARLTEKMPDLQVIIVTVYKDTDLIFQALKAGACGYILKRFRPEEIIRAIAEVRAGSGGRGRTLFPGARGLNITERIGGLPLIRGPNSRLVVPGLHPPAGAPASASRVV